MLIVRQIAWDHEEHWWLLFFAMQFTTALSHLINLHHSKKNLVERSLCADTTWTALWDHIRTFSSQGLATPVRPLETREVILIWCCVVVFAQFIIHCPLFTCGKETWDPIFLLLYSLFSTNSNQWWCHQSSPLLHINGQLHILLLSCVNASSPITSEPENFQNNRWAIVSSK